MSSLFQVVAPDDLSRRRIVTWRDGAQPHRYRLSDQQPQTAPRSATSLVTQGSPERPLQFDVSSRFGRRLRELRRERDLTQASMAKKFGIDRSFISDVERGRKSISLPMLEVIALGLQMSLSDLFLDL